MDLAQRMGAGTLVGGGYYRQGDTLHFQARFTDVAHGRLLQAPEPVAGPASAPLGAIAELRDRVMVGLATALTRRVVHVREAAPPPSMDAYRAYLDGLELFIRGRWGPALAHFRRASRIEPDWALPRIVCAIALWNLEKLEEAHQTASAAASCVRRWDASRAPCSTWCSRGWPAIGPPPTTRRGSRPASLRDRSRTSRWRRRRGV